METDPSFCTKKSRKPYTLTKQRESWTNDEHERFIKALQLYNRDWKKIETYVGTKTVVQIRSHAQKYFQKVLKSGSSDAIPPPRPKRRAADAPLASQASSALPDTKIVRLTSEASTRAGSLKAEIDSDEGGQQQNSKQDISASVRNNDNVEANAQLEQARATVSSQSLQHVYLFIASMFSPAQANHSNMLQQLTERDRTLVVQLLRVLDQELSAQQQQQPAEQQQQPPAEQQQQQEGQLQQQQLAKPLQERQQESQQPGQQQPEQQEGQIVPALPDAAQRLEAAIQQSIQTAAAGPQQPAGQGAAEQLPLLAAGAPTGEAPLASNAVKADTGTQAAAGVEQSLLHGAGELVATDGPPITDTGQSLAAVVVMAAGTEAQAAGQQSLQQGHGGLQQAAGSPDACLLSAPAAKPTKHGPGGCQTAVHERQQPATDAVVAASAANQQQQQQALQQAKPQLLGAVGQGQQQQQQVASMQPAGNPAANGLGSNTGLGARGFTAFAAYAASATQQR